jgi:sporulation protein YlmC with PRC-barrel domain
MVHLSEVLGLPVFDAEGSRIGRVDDLRVDSHRGSVEGLVLRIRGEVRSVPWRAIDSFSPEHRRVSLIEHADPSPWNPGEPDVICLRRDVLDRQIIDTQGRKVVRVNDIALEAAGASS